MKSLVDGISRQFKSEKETLSKIKSVIKYKPPITEGLVIENPDEVSERERFLLNLGRIQSKIAFLWKKSTKI